jgi:hypothetical protein
MESRGIYAFQSDKKVGFFKEMVRITNYATICKSSSGGIWEKEQPARYSFFPSMQSSLKGLGSVAKG